MLFGSLLLPASEQSTILHKCIDWGVRGGGGGWGRGVLAVTPFQPFAISLCAPGCSRQHKEEYTSKFSLQRRLDGSGSIILLLIADRTLNPPHRNRFDLKGRAF